MGSDEQQYALCNSCGKLFTVEALQAIPVVGMPVRAKICKSCLAATEERSKL